MAKAATPRKRYGRRIKDGEANTEKVYSLLRRAETPTQIQSQTLSGASAGSNTGQTKGDFLPTKGGTMVGPIAFFPILVSIAKGNMDISNTTDNYSSRIILSPQSGATDDLLTITGATFSGQLLFIQGVESDTITIKNGIDATATAWAASTSYSEGDVVKSSTPAGQLYHAKSAHTSSIAGAVGDEPNVGDTWEDKWFQANIETIESTDFSLADDDIIMFMFDVTDNKWQQITTGKQGVSVGGAGVSFPILSPINAIGTISSGTTNIDLSATTAHIHTMTLGGNVTITFTNPPASTDHIVFELYILQDGTGSRGITFTDTLNSGVTIDQAADSLTKVVFQTKDGGATYDVEQAEAIFSGGLSDLTIDTDKDWLNFDITNLGKLNITKIDATAITELEGAHITPADAQVIGQIDFIDNDDAVTPNRDTYAQIRALIEDPTTTAEDGEMFLSVIKAATLTDYISLNEANNDLVIIKKTLEFADAGNQLHTNSTGLFIDIANTDVLRIRDVTTELATIDEVNGLKMARRIQGIKGSDVASADAPTLGDGNYFDITGTTTINHIQNTAWQAGSTVSLQFDDAVTLTHQAGTPAGDEADLWLAGAANASMTADDVITLVFDGTNWRETARSVN